MQLFLEEDFASHLNILDLPFGIPMAEPTMLGLPDIVDQLLLRKCMDKGSKLEFQIGGVGDSMELTLRWHKRGSRWEQPFSDSVKYKSPATRVYRIITGISYRMSGKILNL